MMTTDEAYIEACYKIRVSQYVKLINRKLQLGINDKLPDNLVNNYNEILLLNKKINETRGFFVTINFNNDLILANCPTVYLNMVLNWLKESKAANKNAKAYYYLSVEQRGYPPKYFKQNLHDPEIAKLPIGSGLHIHFWLSKTNEKSRIRQALWDKLYKFIGPNSTKLSGRNNNKLLNIKEIGAEFLQDKQAYMNGQKTSQHKLLKVEADKIYRKGYDIEPFYTNFDKEFTPMIRKKKNETKTINIDGKSYDLI